MIHRDDRAVEPQLLYSFGGRVHCVRQSLVSGDQFRLNQSQTMWVRLRPVQHHIDEVHAERFLNRDTSVAL